MIADTTLGRPFSHVVMDTKAGKDAHMAVIHLDWKMNNQLALWRTQEKAQIISQAHKIGHGIKLGLRHAIGTCTR